VLSFSSGFPAFLLLDKIIVFKALMLFSSTDFRGNNAGGEILSEWVVEQEAIQ
jgi:hypothetical protein